MNLIDILKPQIFILERFSDRIFLICKNKLHINLFFLMFYKKNAISLVKPQPRSILARGMSSSSAVVRVLSATPAHGDT